MPDLATYTAVLLTSRTTVQHIAALLQRQRLHLGTRTGRRAPGVFAHAVLICRYLLDATRIADLARGNGALVTATAATSKSSPPPLNGRFTSQRCAPAVSTTPPAQGSGRPAARSGGVHRRRPRGPR
ncbi:hypothetical protein Krad_1056 [Kineococcus radiotolerans SRS30216 = ATCC BAA-149]|uniref:Uncharacterized protein n=1 Tax=Kineococcus radiotolerans (strain ATCC BAA-149 / DSM 14245 / SRS30216) TaxID=266940 RepID=A6W6V5_KINRD|nr:hypothetical protein Krad_1056 [Kineococcus radiotolerans SRS30216 = ATCC BAA-149]